jgi:hypothetical protein
MLIILFKYIILFNTIIKIIMENKDNIDFSIVEENSKEDNFDIDDFLKEFEKTTDKYNSNEDFVFPQMVNYSLNYTVKELLVICEYYGIAKALKVSKCNKETIINILIDFESNPLNADIVFKRQNMWFYINELKNDRFMKKFIILW